MPDITAGILAVLANDTDLKTLTNGGFWDRALRRDGAKPTPQAFESTPPHLPRRSIAVIGGASTGDTTLPGMRIASANVWIRVPDAPEDIDISRAMVMRCYQLLAFQVVGDVSTGDVGMVEVTEQFTMQEDPFTKGGVMNYMRLNIHGV